MEIKLKKEDKNGIWGRDYCIPYEIIQSAFLYKMSLKPLVSTSLSASYMYKKKEKINKSCSICLLA